MKELYDSKQNTGLIDKDNPDVKFFFVLVYYSYSMAKKYEDTKTLAIMNQNGFQEMYDYWTNN